MILLNPVAFVLMVCGASLGYAFDGVHGASIGLAATSFVSVVVSIFGGKKNA